MSISRHTRTTTVRVDTKDAAGIADVAGIMNALDTSSTDATNTTDTTSTASTNNFSIRFKNVYADSDTGDFVILNNINVELTEPRIAIVGNNGSGKSTFARCATGIQAIRKCKDSNISIHGVSLFNRKSHTWKSINMTFQIPDQQIVMPSVQEELELGLKQSHWSKSHIAEKIDFALDILQVSPTQATHSLSAGQKRMLCLLSILLMEPQTIILDEPTTFLDMPAKIRIMKFIETLPMQLLLITHDLFLIEHFSRVLCFDKGSIAYDGNFADAIKVYKSLW